MLVHIGMVAIGGFFGAISRFGISKWMKDRFPTTFPFATLIVNALGSLLLGILVGSNLENPFQLTLGTGFMGAFTTFSTFMLENIQLHEKRKWQVPFFYIGLSLTLGIILALLGIRFGVWLMG